MTTSKRQRLTLFLHPDIIKHSKAQAIVEGKTLTALVEESLIAYLPKQTVIKKPVLKK